MEFLYYDNKNIDTWLNFHNLVNEEWYIRYINSLYYTVLTMITVAYIETKSHTEKACSIFIVLVLSGVFAYTLNAIGNIV